uniref:Acetyl-coenzyme A carboxylase carboxyl transferase subunit beta, chloroplastic n=1 Tax=Gastrodia angusta TaxID=2939659 RepID=A0A976UF61_9ASPA|nr:acetyl-CoA carboxylase carboxyltransferase beta subunit [Gastrodia angusta]UVG40833.1 acetyl-CoA carboxylase carboxyltransferase beta subunit [Gastrodia angusta]
MKEIWFNLLLAKRVEYKWSLIRYKNNNNIDDFLGHIKEAEDLSVRDKSNPSWDSSNLENTNSLNYFFDIKNIWSIISDYTILVRKKDAKNSSIIMYFDIDNQLFDLDKEDYYKLKFLIYSFLNNRVYMNKNNSSEFYVYDKNIKNIWNNYINSCVDCYLSYEITYIYKVLDLYIYGFFFEESKSNDNIKTDDINDADYLDLDIEDINNKYKKLWVQCDNCYGLNYKKLFKSRMNICEHCNFHLKMSSSDRIDLLIDPGTWEPMDENILSINPIEFYSEEESYTDRLYFYQIRTGLIEAVQTGIGKLNNIPVAMGVMDFQFMGGSMGSVVGEKITRLIEYANTQSLPVIIICASGGARMQEGSLSLMQMAKISSVLYDYQLNKNLFYISILTSPTTGGVTASFGMLGDVIIVEPNAYIAFAGKRVIEQTLKKIVPEGLQTAENLFHKGLFDLIVPRNILKGVVYELFELQGFLPLDIDLKK